MPQCGDWALKEKYPPVSTAVPLDSSSFSPEPTMNDPEITETTSSALWRCGGYLVAPGVLRRRTELPLAGAPLRRERFTPSGRVLCSTPLILGASTAPVSS